MLKKIALAVGYAKAPKATFVMRHPKAGVAALAVAQGLRESPTARKVVFGLFGLGALTVALPTLAVWALRR
ncbi:MAG TPA: hypothetical protein VGS57_22755 [Thermoanaerobaculia bacterium]|jgi:hypothetical protein|nr:hypothetical protein [Thermoanaerobaculia bacterium]